ncbi:MAG: hypothetical protein IPH09_10760 [bacterium]|nr:hypothetical protein [bacterium]
MLPARISPTKGKRHEDPVEPAGSDPAALDQERREHQDAEQIQVADELHLELVLQDPHVHHQVAGAVPGQDDRQRQDPPHRGQDCRRVEEHGETVRVGVAAGVDRPGRPQQRPQGEGGEGQDHDQMGRDRYRRVMEQPEMVEDDRDAVAPGKEEQRRRNAAVETQGQDEAADEDQPEDDDPDEAGPRHVAPPLEIALTARPSA